MHSDEYRRLNAACLCMAWQSDLPAVRARWLSIAQAWLELSNDAYDVQPNAHLTRSDYRPTVLHPGSVPAPSGPRA
jgi:hypothetical protein